MDKNKVKKLLRNTEREIDKINAILRDANRRFEMMKDYHTSITQLLIGEESSPEIAQEATVQKKSRNYSKYEIRRRDGSIVSANLTMGETVNQLINDAAPNNNVSVFKNHFNHRDFPEKQDIVITGSEYEQNRLKDKQIRFEIVRNQSADGETLRTWKGWTTGGNFPNFKRVATRLGYKINLLR